mmetsp:Transcript_8677/g.13699  ORF Transcript_8677/g.13699 Transcript_8677/m.13699 type:complete len:429 (+) Transcript_8677:69-1355(+)
MTSSSGSGAPSSGAASFYGGNQHNDVLRAVPDSEDAKLRLVEELKRRGNAAFKLGSMPEAEALYSKAIEHNGNMAALYGNRSMTRCKMGMFKEALEDGKMAVKTDDKWPKGYFRCAEAEIGLNRFDDATSSLRSCLELEPANKAAKKELGLMDERRKKYEAKAAKDKIRSDKEAEEKRAREAKQMATRKVVSRAPVGEKKATEKTNGGDVDMSMRGYKVLADGRKTTFFNRELTEEEKEMLKDNAPKAIDKPMECVNENLAKEGASAWNSGGTFEEKDMSDWAEKRLKELLAGITCTVSVEGKNFKNGDSLKFEEMKVNDIAGLDGHASIAFTRGKKVHIFDYEFEAKWQVFVDGVKAKGSLFFPEVSGDSVQDGSVVDAELRWPNRGAISQGDQQRIRSAVVGKNDSLLGQFNDAVHKFAKEFRAMQ